ncbi:MAG: redoxin domain-containing protein [Acidobacteria bacterium]|nr:redoxin domain-containing protein [Acidobacteriota bacterium]
MPLTIGAAAPDFELDSHLGRKVRLSSFRGRKNVVIAFHPLAWTPVCARQMTGYEAERDWFADRDTVLVGVSVDAVPSKVEWAKSLGGISYDLVSDFHPHGAVAEAYGVARDGGISERAVFVVDKAGAIAFAKVYDIPTLPDNAEVRQAIERLA